MTFPLQQHMQAAIAEPPPFCRELAQALPLGRVAPDEGKVVDALYDAVRADRLPLHDGRWGTATPEVCLAIVESSRTRRDVLVSHQVPTRD